jgi:hypothetical protein
MLFRMSAKELSTKSVKESLEVEWSYKNNFLLSFPDKLYKILEKNYRNRESFKHKKKY